MRSLLYIFISICLFGAEGAFASLSCTQVLTSGLSANQMKVIDGLNELNNVLIGQSDVKRFTVIGLITGGHILFEGPTGTGKTDLTKNLGKIFGLTTSRTTFNPEITPSQLVGYKMRDINTGEAIDVPGDMIGAQIYHADELNRASPRTTNALLEGMEENQITQDGHTTQLEENFVTIATQNPKDQAGTYELSEASLDRFMFQIASGYLSGNDFLELARMANGNGPKKETKQVLEGSELSSIKEEVLKVDISERLLGKMTRALDLLDGEEQGGLGGVDFSEIKEVFKTRGLFSWILAAKGEAYLNGRTDATAQDLIKVAPFVLAHRVKLNARGAISREKSEKINGFIKEALSMSGLE